jgi:F-type H+-transporting ATPase subunit b
MRRSSLTVLAGWVALALLLGTAGVASAAEAAGGAPKNRDIFEWALDLGIWTIVVFLVLMFVLKKYAWGPMLEGLHKREENLFSAIEDARKAREEASRLRETIQRELDKIGEQARKEMDEARRHGQQLIEEMKAKSLKEIQEDRDRLHREINLARDQALKQIWDQTAQLATLVSAKAIHRQITVDDHRRLVDEALAEMQHSGEAKYREVSSVRA